LIEPSGPRSKINSKGKDGHSRESDDRDDGYSERKGVQPLPVEPAQNHLTTEAAR
jgi:hypothetical protein